MHLSSLTPFPHPENGVDGGGKSPNIHPGYYEEFCRSSALCMKTIMLHLFFRPDILWWEEKKTINTLTLPGTMSESKIGSFLCSIFYKTMRGKREQGYVALCWNSEGSLQEIDGVVLWLHDWQHHLWTLQNINSSLHRTYQPRACWIGILKGIDAILMISQAWE